MILVVEPKLRELRISAFGAEDAVSFLNVPFGSVRPDTLRREIRRFTKGRRIETIAFKVLFGGDYFNGPARVNAQFFATFDKLTGLFPFYIPRVKEILQVFYATFKNVPLTVFFETSFFTRLPEEERYYAIPSGYYQDNRIKKFGFHGIFHEANSRLFPSNKKIISIVLDKQTTVCSVYKEKPRTISLGYTPLEGVMGLTTCGDLDPGIVFYLMNRYKYSLFQIDEILKKRGGFFGITGYNLSFQEFAKLYGNDTRVDVAFEVYQNQILKYIGEGIAAMGGIDAIVFCGCYGDILTQVIYTLLKKISFLGISLIAMPWEKKSEIVRIDAGNAGPQVWINRCSAERIIFKEAEGFKR